MARKPAPRYPWGTETPGPRLRTLCAKTRTALEQADAPGFHRIGERIDTAVKAVRPLVETMEFVARAGLRTGPRVDGTVQGVDAFDAARAVGEALIALEASSARTQSGCYETFVAAVEALMALAESGIEHGIAGNEESGAGNPWHAFGA